MQPRLSYLLLSGLLTLLIAAATPVRAQQPAAPSPAADAVSEQTAEQITFFEREVRPLLSTRCFKCHADEKQQGNLRLDSRAAILAGGDLGAAVTPGDVEESRLVEVVRYTGDIRMPPDGRLNDREIAALSRWVKEGLAWPKSETKDGTPASPSTAAKSANPLPWSFQPVTDPTPPATESDWIRSPLDQFVLQKLLDAGLTPAPAAEKRMLLRRAKFDLLGLPPTPAEIDAFLADDSPEAFARCVDRFLAMPEYGQRWGRHWLDVARYADSNGQDENLAYVNAYRYRDYVIDAFHRDKPYDQFVREQIAGDLLPDTGNPDARSERIIATGFLTLGPKMLAEDDPMKMEMDIVDEQVDAIGGAFLGLTLGCARCHDHKFDPVSAADYYAVAGILKSTQSMDNFKVVATWHERPLGSPAEIEAFADHTAQLAKKKAEISERTEIATSAVIATARERIADYLLAATEQLESSPLASLLPPPDAADMGVPAGAILREAEQFDRGNVLVDTTNYGAGIGIVLNRGETPNFVEFDLEIPQAGAYQLEIRYAAAEARSVQVLIDGKLRAADAADEVTGSWFADTQRWSPVGVYELPSGKIVLRVERAAGPFPHLDRLALVPVSAEQAARQRTQSTEDLSRDRGLIDVIVKQWVAHLGAAQKDPLSVWQPWFAYRRDGKLSPESFTGASAVVAARLLKAGTPADAAELAERYRTEIESADQRAQVPQPANGAPPTDAADNAVDESLRSVLLGKNGRQRRPAALEKHFAKADRDDIDRLKSGLTELERSAPAPLPLAMSVEDGKATDLRIHIRGSHLTLGELAPRGFPKALSSAAPTLAPDTSGRLQLAQWITEPTNPLTSRVMVNRLWRWHFGAGIVRSTDNFGNLGDRPSHPELLDWLASRFVESGWSVKAMHRLIMLSATYQMGASHNAAALEVDPDNRVLWRMSRRRLEAEAVRDALLSVGGRLDTSMGGTLLKSKPREYVTGTASTNSTSYQTDRRSVYLPVVRSALYEAFQAFDFAEPTTIKGDRETTTIASQALFMMNSEVMQQQSALLAERLIAEFPHDQAARVRSLYVTTLGRPADAAETSRALAFVDRYATVAQAEGPVPEGPVPEGSVANAPDLKAPVQAWQALCRVVLSSNEFLYVE